MWWINPYWLIALFLLFPLLKSGNILRNKLNIIHQGRNLKESSQNQIKRLSWLRISAVILIILALAGTIAVFPAKNSHIVALIDVSDSIGKEQVEKARDLLLKKIKELNDTDRISIITFAGKPRIIVPITAARREALLLLESAALDAPDTMESDLHKAIISAVEMLSKSLGNRSILLFTDGRATTGGSIDSSSLMFSRIPIYTIPIGQTGEGIISKELKLPETSHSDESIKTEWNINSTRGRNIGFVLKIDGKTVKKGALDLQAGINKIPLEFLSGNPGNHRVDIEMFTEEGKPAVNGNISGILKVEGKPSVLLVHGNQVNKSLGRALQIQGMIIRDAGREEIPEAAGILNSYSAVILDNVPAGGLTESQQKALQNYAAAGGGLLVIGGDSSLGRGEYYDSVLEEILPVSTDTRQRILFSQAEIIFVIDHSGSMLEYVGNITKYDAALIGVMKSVKELRPQDRVGIIAFAEQAKWALRLTSAGSISEIKKALEHIEQGGGTDMSSAFEEVLRKFPGQGPVRRHLIVITDGQTPLKDFQSLSRRLGSAGFSVTTIGIGNEINEPLLRDVAKWGKGKFYHVNVDQMPLIIQNETVRVTRDLIKEGLFIPAITMKADFLGALNLGIPPVKGYLITKPKNLASVYLTAGKEDPLLAVWRYGNGKTAVFTSDSGNRWLSLWSGTKAYNLFFSQVVRSIGQGVQDKALRVSSSIENSTAHIAVDAIQQDKKPVSGLQLTGRTSDGYGRTFLFRESAYGRYEADIPVSNTGLNVFDIREEGGDRRTTAWLWNPAGKEMDTTGPDLPALSQISLNSGGKLLSLNKIELPDSRWGFEPVPLQNILLLAAITLFLLELFLRSTSMKQLKMGRAVLSVWWSVKTKIIDQAFRLTQPEDIEQIKKRNTLENENDRQKAREAYWYLAKQSRNRSD